MIIQLGEQETPTHEQIQSVKLKFIFLFQESFVLRLYGQLHELGARARTCSISAS